MIKFHIRTAMIGLYALIALSAVSLKAHAADPIKLEAIDVQTQGQQVQLKLRLSGPAPDPMSFTIDKPARIAFDLPNTTLALSSRRVDVRSGGVDSVLAAEANGRTRLVVNVDSLLPYTTKVDGNNITVTLGSLPGSAVPGAMPARAGSGSAVGSAERSIRTIDFRRGADGTGRVIVQLTDPRTPVNVRQEGNQVVVDFAGHSRRGKLAPGHQRAGRFRTAGLPVRQSVHHRNQAFAQAGECGRKEGIHRRTADAELPGHRR
jgi:type IV pilus assembly protein PilQ